jgi:hypothetical protein
MRLGRQSTASSPSCAGIARAQERIAMVELNFAVEGAVVDRYAAAPSLLFKLCVANETPDVRVENVLLHCQIRIEATRRTYAPEDRERLIELFGVTHRWKDTLQACFGRTRTSGCRLSMASASSNCRSHAASISMLRQPSISSALKEAKCRWYSCSVAPSSIGMPVASCRWI